MQLFVLGMHRSGTSMVTRILNLMGAYFGPEHVGMRPAADNPKGFWERQDVYELNESLLNAPSTSWFQISNFQLADLSKERKDHFRNGAARIIFDMDAHRPWVIKDPRNCFTFPLWRELLEVPICIHVYRNPYEIALSLKKRNDFPIPFGVALWEEYTIQAFEASRDLPKVFVNHEELMENAPAVVEKLFHDLASKGVQGLRIPTEKELSAFINKSLYRARDETNALQDLLTTGQQAICQAIEKEQVAWLDNIREMIDYPGRQDLLRQYEHFRKTENEATEVKDELKLVSEKLQEAELQLTHLSEKLVEKEKANLYLSEEKQKIAEEAGTKISGLEQEKQTLAQAHEEIIKTLETRLETRLESFFDKHAQNVATLASTQSKLQQLESSFRSEKARLAAENEALEQQVGVLEGRLRQHESSSQSEKAELRQQIGVLEGRLQQLKSSFQSEKTMLIQEKEDALQQAELLEQHLTQSITALYKTITEQSAAIDSISYSEGEHLYVLREKFQHHLKEIEEAHRANLNSWRWKIGHTAVRTLERLLGRKEPRLGVHVINDSIERLQAYTQVLEPSAKMRNTEIPVLDQDDLDDMLARVNGTTSKTFEVGHLNGEITSPLDEKPSVQLVSRNKKFRILYISPHLPDYDTSSGGKRAFRMLSLLAENCQVYAYTPGQRPDKHKSALEKAGVSVFETNVLEEAKHALPEVDAIIYAWYYTYFDAGAFTRYFPTATVIVDTVDVHWVREERSLGILEGLTEHQIKVNKKREISAYRAADIVWAVTENDKQAILKEIPGADVRVVSNIHQPVRQQFQPAREKNILFFGGYQHYPNISAVRKLALEIFPQIRQEVPEAKLLIAGSRAPVEVSALGQLEGIDFLGFIEDTEIKALYNRTALIIAPLLAGAGIKGKICEAAAYMVPVVTNTIGNEGIQLENEVDAFITDDFEEMAHYSIGILKGTYDLPAITENAQKKILDIVGPENARKGMINSLAKPVSICIVTWNRLGLLKKCIQSIIDYTVYPNYVVLVHSNGCTDGTQEYLRTVAEEDPRIIPILSETNDVFVKPNNAMMQKFPGNDAVLVNNDVTVTEGWLLELYRTAYSSEKAGIVGAKILYPDGKLQEFGSELYHDGTGRNIGKWDDPNKPEYQKVKKSGYVSGCAMFIKWSTIRQIGVFDEQFHPCYCEDSDYCYTAWENQLETLVTPKSIIYHFEGGTSGTDTDKGFKSYQKINMQKFLQKHRGKNNGIEWGIEKKAKNKLERSFCEQLNDSFKTEYSDGFGKEILANTSLHNSPTNRFSFSIVSSFREFLEYEKNMEHAYSRRISIENEIRGCSKDATSTLWGFNPMIEEKVPYTIRRKTLADGREVVNFRETLTCPVTKTNSRLRATALAIDEVIKDIDHAALNIYFLEQKTPCFNFYKSKFPNLQGSEYFGPSFKSGEFVDGVRHEDVTSLSFDKGSFDLIVALEVLEHVPDFRAGLREIYRCLKKDGTAIITVPFLMNQEQTKIRATVDGAGKINHILPPEYHGDPVKSGEGILCFYHFGWDLIEALKLAGFSDVKVLLGWSLYHGVLGKDISIIQAKK